MTEPGRPVPPEPDRQWLGIKSEIERLRQGLERVERMAWEMYRGNQGRKAEGEGE